MNKAVELKIEGNYGYIIFNDPEKRMNLLTSPVMKELERIIDHDLPKNSIDALIFKSCKPGCFIAGADVNEVKNLKDQETAAADSRAGQEIFSKIEALDVNTVALIDGVCLGGGFELTLACNYRIATDSKKTKIGLPETKLGILPGFGGTNRLPLLCGLSTALDIIVKGKIVDADKALKLKMVDRVIPAEFIVEKLAEFLKLIASEKLREQIISRRKQKKPLAKILDNTKPGRSFLVKTAEKNILKQTKGKYPAQLEALKVMEKAASGEQAFEDESEAFGRLMASNVTENLLNLYFISQEIKKDPQIDYTGEEKNIRQAAVVGAGVMGGGISWLFSNGDMPVRMKDISWDAIELGYSSIGKIYKNLEAKGKLSPREAGLKKHKVTGSIDMLGLEKNDLVIEAVFENKEVKKKVYAELEDILPEDTIIATNTSSIPITELAADLKHPERFIGLHFFNPVDRMPLVEIISGEKTSPQTVFTLIKLMKKLGKTPVHVGDCYGFLINRVLLQYLNEAGKLLEEGVEAERIDRVLTDFGMPMGAFLLMDEIGIDVGFKVAEILEKAEGTDFEMAKVFRLLGENKKYLGKKSGAGFYIHGKNRRINPPVARLIKQKIVKENVQYGDHDIIHRCLGMMVKELASAIEEGIITNPGYADLAFIMGTGFPAFRGGPLKWLDEFGIKHMVTVLENLAAEKGKAYAPPALLKSMAEKGESFYSIKSDQGN